MYDIVICFILDNKFICYGRRCYCFCSIVIVNCTGDVQDTGSQKVFGGSVPSVGFSQLASKNVGWSSAMSASITTVSDQPPSSSPVCRSEDTNSVFGSGTKVVGFADVATSGSGFGKKSG